MVELDSVACSTVEIVELDPEVELGVETDDVVAPSDVLCEANAMKATAPIAIMTTTAKTTMMVPTPFREGVA